MLDVSIVHTRDKAKAAARLKDSLAEAGYSAELDELRDARRFPSADELEGRSSATLLVWSRELAQAAVFGGWLRSIRKVPSVIEVSADGIAPPSPSDTDRVVLLSGWRGQPFHPGWQRIEAEVKRLCGSRKSAPAPAPSTEPAHARSSEARSSTLRERNEGLPWRGIGVAAALMAAILLAALWLAQSKPGPQASPAPVVGERSRTAIPPAPAAEPKPEASETGAAQPNEEPVSTAAPAPPAAPAQAPVQAELKPGEPKEKADRPTRHPKRAAPAKSPPAERKHYSRRNSKVMRLFCEGPGHGTPQCKQFVRSVRDQR